jgi:hypothetical protein
VLDEDNPEEAEVEKPTLLLSFLNVNEGKGINRHKNLKLQWQTQGMFLLLDLQNNNEES